MKIVIPGELTDLNTYINRERANRFAGAALKKKDTQRVALECRVSRTHKALAPVKIIYSWYCKNKRKDKSNISFAKKFIEDGLVLAGVLSNDGWDDIIGFEDRFFLDAANPRIEVEICESNIL